MQESSTQSELQTNIFLFKQQMGDKQTNSTAEVT